MPMFVPQVTEIITQKIDEDEDDDNVPLTLHVFAFEVITGIAKLGGDIGPEFRKTFSELAWKQMRCVTAASRMMASELLEKLVPSYKFAPEIETKHFVNESLTYLVRGMKAASHADHGRYGCLEAHFDTTAALAEEFGSLFLPARIVDISDALSFFCNEAVRIRTTWKRAQKEKEAKKLAAAKAKGGKFSKKKKPSEEDEDDEEEEEEEDDDDGVEEAFDLLLTMNDTIEHMLKKCPEFTPLYREKLLPIALYSMPRADDEVFSVGLGYISDYCQNSYQNAALDDAETIAKVLLSFTGPEHKEVAHGIYNALRELLILVTEGNGAKADKNIDFARVVLPIVIAFMKWHKKEKSTDHGALNNALSCGIANVSYYSESLEAREVSDFFSTLLTLTPLSKEGDFLEATSVHKRLVEMLSGPAEKCLIEESLRSKFVKKLKKADPKTIDKDTKVALGQLK